MRGNELLYKMELVDPAFIEEAEAAPQRVGSKLRIWGSVAACFLLLVGIIAAVRAGVFTDMQTEKTDASDPSGTFHVGYGFYLEDNEDIAYFPIDFDDRIRFGLLPKNAVNLDRRFTITEADLGEFMGTVNGCYDSAMNGCKVYHYARFPEKDAICVVDTPLGYALYTGRYYGYIAAVGDCSDELFSWYGLPDSLEKMEILTAGERFLFEITDKAQISTVLEILSGKTNIGVIASDYLYAQAWYDAYGNEDVSFNEEQGFVFRDSNAEKKEGENEESASEREFSESTYNKATALWGKGCRRIQLMTAKGFRLVIEYVPVVRSFWEGSGGHYMLSEEETETLNAILKITD